MFIKLKKIFMLGLVLSFCSCYFGNAKAFNTTALNMLNTLNKMFYEAHNQCMDNKEEKDYLISNWINTTVILTKCLEDTNKLIDELEIGLDRCILETDYDLRSFDKYKLLCDYIRCDYEFCLEQLGNDAYVQTIIDHFYSVALKFLDSIGYRNIQLKYESKI